MTDKEKEAVNFFYNLRAAIDESIMLFDEDINVKHGKETIKQITTVLNLIQTHQAEIKKKDKIIDLMSEELTTPIHSKEWVKDYYERKSENGN